MLLGDPGSGGGWELVADGWAQGLFKAAASIGGLLCWVFSGAVATHNGGPGMPSFLCFLLLHLLYHLFLRRLPAPRFFFFFLASPRGLHFPRSWASSPSLYRPPGGPFRAPWQARDPLSFLPCILPGLDWLPGLFLCSSASIGPFLPLSLGQSTQNIYEDRGLQIWAPTAPHKNFQSYTHRAFVHWHLNVFTVNVNSCKGYNCQHAAH